MLSRFIENTKMVSENSVKREVNVSLESKSSFMIRIFCDYINDDNVVCFGDIVWLHHLESDSILVTLKNN